MLTQKKKVLYVSAVFGSLINIFLRNLLPVTALQLQMTGVVMLPVVGMHTYRKMAFTNRIQLYPGTSMHRVPTFEPLTLLHTYRYAVPNM
jgi:hypothetical protein